MKITNSQYSKMTDKASPPSHKVKDFIGAFLIGGLICAIGQMFKELYLYLGLTEEQVLMAVPCSLIFLAALFTGLKLFEKIAKHAGAGTLVPITGFANAVVSPALEFKTEGWVLGVGASIFKIAGPVIAYGTAASVVFGFIYWIMKMI